MVKRVILLTGFLVCAASSVGAVPGVFRNDTGTLSMGNAGVATGYKGNGFLYNPALLDRIGGVNVSFAFPFGVNTDLFDVIDYVDENREKFKGFGDDAGAADDLLKGMQSFDGKWVRVNTSPAFSFAMRHYGIAVYNVTKIGVKVDRGVYEPKVFVEGQVDIVEQVGGSHEVNEKVVLGGALKLIQRSQTTKKLGASEIGDFGDVVDDIGDDITDFKSGWGVDIGGLYRIWWEKLEVGWVLQDFVGSIDGKDVPLVVKAGASFHPINRVLLAGDYTDLLNRQGENFFRKFHLGGEYDLRATEHLGFVFRTGFNQGYPTVGAGLNLKIIKLDYAFYSVEQGRFTGQDGQGQHEVQLKFGWGW